MTTLYITHPAFRLHDMGPWHPECPARLDAVSDQLLASGVMSYLTEREAPDATDATTRAIERVHAPEYLARLAAWAPADGFHSIDGDTLMNPHTLPAARLAVSASVAAVDAVMANEAHSAFCAVRPPGHHAEHAAAMGFCFFNNAAIAVRHALEVHGLERVALIDFDVHHGNGSEQALAGDARVLMCSFFEHPLFPFSGNGPHAENMINVPLVAGSKGDDVRRVLRCDWLPALEQFQPQLVVISAGFDAHREDDMAHMGLVEDDYAWITTQLVEVAQRHAQGRIVSCLEGGYNLSALGRSVVAHLRALAGLS